MGRVITHMVMHMNTLCEHLGISQEELAVQLGLCPNILDDYMSMRQRVPAGLWFDFCERFDLEPSCAIDSKLILR